jgi:hypothetical protein
LNADANVKSITLSDGGTPILNLTAAQALNDSSALGEITKAIFSININGVTANIVGGGGPGGLLAVGGGKTINFGSVTGNSARL